MVSIENRKRTGGLADSANRSMRKILDLVFTATAKPLVPVVL